MIFRWFIFFGAIFGHFRSFFGYFGIKGFTFEKWFLGFLEGLWRTSNVFSSKLLAFTKGPGMRNGFRKANLKDPFVIGIINRITV